MAEGLSAALAEGRHLDESLGQIDALLWQVAGVEGRLGSVRQQWRDLGGQAGPELQAVLDQLTGLIERLSRQVRETEQVAAANRDALLPALETAARVQQMRQAYGRSGTTHL